MKKQMIKAISQLYLQRLWNPFTNTFTDPVYVLLNYLSTTYSNIAREELKEKKNKLEMIVFDIEKPLILLFNQIKDLSDLAAAANCPLTTPQLVGIGVTLIKNMCDF